MNWYRAIDSAEKIMILTYKRSWWFSLLLLLALCPALPAQTEQPTPETSPAEQAPAPIPLESPGPVQPTAQPLSSQSQFRAILSLTPLGSWLDCP